MVKQLYVEHYNTFIFTSDLFMQQSNPSILNAMVYMDFFLDSNILALFGIFTIVLAKICITSEKKEVKCSFRHF